MKEEKKENLLDEKIEEMETEESPKEKIQKEKRKKYIIKGISSTIACIIHTCGYFSIWVIGNSVVYLISFRRHYNSKLTFSYGYFLFPIMNFTLSLTSPIGGIIEDKIGSKKTIFLSTLILCFSFSIMLLSRNIFLDYALMSLNGFGMAVGINITRKNACSFFMKKKALICGIVFLIPGLVNAALAIFYEKYILNPLSENPTVENIYYGEKIFLNFQNLIIFEIGFIIITSFLTLLLYYQNNPKETIEFGFEERIDDDNKNTKNKNNIPKQIKIQRALQKKRAVKLFVMIFSFFPTINFMTNTMRPIGIYYKLNTYYLQLIGALFSIIGCISSIIFALIGDKIQFRILFCLFAIFLSISSFYFPLTFHNEFLFICEIMIISFVLNGFNIIIDPHMMKVYGIDNYIEIGGVIRSSAGFAEIFSVIFAFYLENNFTGNKDTIYKLMYVISGCFSLISFVLGLFEGDDVFYYDV